MLNEPVLLHQYLYSNSKKIYIESRHGIQHNESDLGATKFEPCPDPRTPIGEIDGKPVYEGDTTYHIVFEDLEIRTSIIDSRSLFEEDEDTSRSYLTPEAVNARLREIVEQKAKDKTFTLVELKEFDKYEYTAIGYAIELIEKEYQVKYLNH